MNFKGLRTKRIIDLNITTKIKDLFQSTIRVLTDSDRAQTPIEYDAVHTVAEWEQGRPDKIAYRYYGTTDYVDALLKYNGVSNPFSLEEGRLFLIPSKAVLDRSYRVLNFKQRRDEDNLTRFTDNVKKGAPDAAKKGFNESKKRNSPPNVLPKGQVAIERDRRKDKVILGANMSNSSNRSN